MSTITRASPPGQVSAQRRPGWVTFAAVVTFIVAGIQTLVALTEFANSTWLYYGPHQTYSLFSSHMLWWGIFDAILAALIFFAGLDLLRGGSYGLLMALFGAGFSAVRWLFYIPASPVLAVVIIAIDIAVIYGLCTSIDYFARDPYASGT